MEKYNIIYADPPWKYERQKGVPFCVPGDVVDLQVPDYGDSGYPEHSGR